MQFSEPFQLTFAKRVAPRGQLVRNLSITRMVGVD